MAVPPRASRVTAWPAVIVLLAACVCLALPAHAQEPAGLLRDGGFEAADFMTAPAWSPIRGDFDAAPDSDHPHQGATSFRLSRTAASTSPFAAVAQAVDAVPLRGKTVRFRAAVRVQGATAASHGGLWLRVDREGGGRGFFDNMSDRPIRSGDWAVYEITGRVAEDATRITVGLLFNGAGSAWIDSASLEIVPTPHAAANDGAPPSARQLDNLAAFARLYGYVRWFSPWSEPNDAAWERIATEGSIAAEAAPDAGALARTLQTLFEPMAPGLRVTVGGLEPAQSVQPASATDLVRWRHSGVAMSNSVYRSERVDADAPDIWTADLGGGLAVSMPFTAERSALPAAGPQPSPPRVGGAGDRATRLGAVVIAWNVFQHFFPYFDDDGAAWEAGLKARLAAAATAREAEDFRGVLETLVADLDDGHGAVLPEADSYALPLLWQPLENTLVVTAVARDAGLPVAVGDVVLAIDGRPAGEALRAERARVSASTDAYRLWRAAQGLLTRTTSRPLTLRLQGAGGLERDVQIAPVAPQSFAATLAENRPAPVTWLAQGVWYFDLTRLDDQRLNDALAQVSGDQPVIFDLRGYPGDVRAGFLGRLADRSVKTPPFRIPVSDRPDAQDRHWTDVGWEIAPSFPRLRGKTAFLTDERAISYAETLLAMVRGHGLADIVGEPTAGTNGNINAFGLPGGYRIVWTGMMVLNHDGTDLDGHGVQPSVPVAATIAGVRAGRDEVLERAIEVVLQR